MEKLKHLNSHLGYKILRSHSPDEFCIALAIRLLFKSNTVFENIFDWLIGWFIDCLFFSGFGEHRKKVAATGAKVVTDMTV